MVDVLHFSSTSSASVWPNEDTRLRLSRLRDNVCNFVLLLLFRACMRVCMPRGD